jgi:hypothetical protein
MRTTVEIADAIRREARKLASRAGTTLSVLIERGLRHVISEGIHKRPFRFGAVTSGGQGLPPELKDASWDEIRDRSYEKGE